MLFNRLYYAVKPWMPRPIVIAARRVQAGWLRRRNTATWPMMESSAQPPAGWPGWPEGKRFAFILTHDVEGPVGLGKVQQMASLEERLGFRSLFNFVPEGPYRVSDELRQNLVQRGFEVGVHGLNHDGRLFHSPELFRQRAARINHYLELWQARGFRAPFMHHNLEWQHQIHADYDLSTFDTDPFEPQPDGVGTIFPFWVPAPSAESQAQSANSGLSSSAEFPSSRLPAPSSEVRRGYLELPYTLPQDSTLFLLLREQTINVWKEKLAWIARHGGMALVNVHPDYCDVGRERGSHRFPARFYREFLEHLARDYAGQFWHALPSQLTDWAAPLRPQKPPPTGKRVSMVVHSAYERDNRVMRYARTLAAAGNTVHVLSLRTSPNLPKEEALDGVLVRRIQDRFTKVEQSKFSYLRPLVRFLALSSLHLVRDQLRYRYQLVHVHNVPDFLVFAAWFPKLAGASVILDVHDIVPEFYASKFGRPDGRTVRMLKVVERLSTAFADHVIISNHLWLEKLVARGTPLSKCSVFINHVDPSLFHPHPRTRHDDCLKILFPGGLQWHQGVDLAIEAFGRLSGEFPNAVFEIYGDGNAKPALVALVKTLGLVNRVRFFEPISLSAVPQLVADADVGVVPKRSNSFGNEAYSTKIMEFMSQRVPVVVARTRIDDFYFSPNVVRFFEPGDVDDLTVALRELLADVSRRATLGLSGFGFAASNSWRHKQADYFRLVERLTA